MPVTDPLARVPAATAPPAVGVPDRAEGDAAVGQGGCVRDARDVPVPAPQVLRVAAAVGVALRGVGAASVATGVEGPSAAAP